LKSGRQELVRVYFLDNDQYNECNGMIIYKTNICQHILISIWSECFSFIFYSYACSQIKCLPGTISTSYFRNIVCTANYLSFMSNIPPPQNFVYNICKCRTAWDVTICKGHETYVTEQEYLHRTRQSWNVYTSLLLKHNSLPSYLHRTRQRLENVHFLYS